MFWIAIAVIVVANLYFSLERRKVELDRRGAGNSKLLRRQVEELYNENEALKERLSHLELQFSDRKDYIDLDYQQEHSRIKKPNQGFEY